MNTGPCTSSPSARRRSSPRSPTPRAALDLAGHARAVAGRGGRGGARARDRALRRRHRPGRARAAARGLAPGAAPRSRATLVEVPDDVRRRRPRRRRRALGHRPRRRGRAARARSTFVSAFCGFAPGFAYLTGLPDDLAVPRLDTPRTRVPAGSVALAGTVVRRLPDGLARRLAAARPHRRVLWDPTATPPALLAPGTRVRFVPR